MKSNSSKLAIAGAAILLATRIAEAHPGHAGHGGLTAGFAHPFSGIDHILAMIAVGLLAAQIGGRAMWMLPLTFVTLMTGGGLLNLAGVRVPWVEQGIMASVLVLGLMIAIAARMPIVMPLFLIGLFAVFHGYAHVAEMRTGASPAGYALGFIAATTALHGIGIALDLAARQLGSRQLVRYAGAAIAVCGLLLFMGLITA
ncbi:MAG: HupE/UreJ family protein [Tepidisphaeraceae bacterium]